MVNVYNEIKLNIGKNIIKKSNEELNNMICKFKNVISTQEDFNKDKNNFKEKEIVLQTEVVKI